MAYEKQTWINKQTPLDAEHMNHIEEGIAAAHEALANLPEAPETPDVPADVTVDATLTQPGAAADAAVVGEKIGELSEEMLPTTDQPHMQLVTDESGAAKWEDRLLYSVVEVKELANETVTVGSDGYAQISSFSGSEFIAGKTYKVVFDGAYYECEAWKSDETGSNCIGNGNIYGGAGNGNGEPFVIDSYPDGTAYLNVENAGAYMISIVGSAVEYHKMDENFLPDRYAPQRYITFTSSKDEFDSFETDVRQNGAYGRIAQDIIISPDGNGIMSSFKRCMRFMTDEEGAFVVNDISYDHPSYRQVGTNRYVDMCPAVSKLNGNGAEIRRTGVIIRSSTPDSTKAFAITVDDNGTITAIEVPE